MSGSPGYNFLTDRPNEEKIAYEYSKCEAEDFILLWQEHRLVFLKKLNLGLKINSKLGTSARGARINGRPIEDLIYEEMMKAKRIPEENLVITRSLVTKFEVWGRLRSHYDANLKACPNSYFASTGNYIEFSRLLLSIAKKSSCLQWLSTALKVNDLICCFPEKDFTKGDEEKLLSLFKKEFNLFQIAKTKYLKFNDR